MKQYQVVFTYLTLHTLMVHTKQVIVCDGVIFHGVYFDKQIVVQNYGRPYNLVVHKYSGILFFSHTIQNGSQVDFGITACYLAKNVCKEIQGVPGGYAIAYDSGNDDIYFGGHDGLYKYNFLTKSAEFFAEKGKSIWGIFIRKHFYYIQYPSQKLFVFQNDMFVQVSEAMNIEVDAFFISKELEIYFYNKTALYRVGRKRRVAEVLNDEVIVRQIVEDAYGDVYFCGHDGVYFQEKPYLRLKKIADIDQAFGLTFDENDHVIYSNKDSIYRLVPSKYGNLCYKALSAPTETVVATE